MINKVLKIFVFFPALFLPIIIAADSPNIVINEIAWMGTNNSANDEWIELYNTSSLDLDIEGWELTAEDGTPAINLTGKVLAKNFFLLERTDDETLPDIKADLIYKGSLNNKGEYLKLFGKDGKIIDEIDCSSEWFTGDNETKATMERKDPLTSGSNSQNWRTSQNLGGTPKAENSQGEKEPEAKKEAGSEPKEKVSSYPSNVFINEILPSPEGPDAENEWIEIFNQNVFEVDLSSWQITDSVGKTKVYTLPQGTVIEAQGFLVLNRLITKITLNNDGDDLTLLHPNGITIDKAGYEKAPRGKSFNKTSSGWLWSSTLTPGVLNIVPSSPPPEQESQEKTETSSQPVEAFSDTQLAVISEQFFEPSSPSFILLIALIVAFLSGAVVLFLRKFTTFSSNFPKQNEG